jgi:hypothetical protein
MDSKESIRLGLVRRAVASGLALLATGFIFTSVTLVFTATGSPIAQATAQLSGT